MRVSTFLLTLTATAALSAGCATSTQLASEARRIDEMCTQQHLGNISSSITTIPAETRRSAYTNWAKCSRNGIQASRSLSRHRDVDLLYAKINYQEALAHGVIDGELSVSQAKLRSAEKEQDLLREMHRRDEVKGAAIQRASATLIEASKPPPDKSINCRSTTLGNTTTTNCD